MNTVSKQVFGGKKFLMIAVVDILVEEGAKLGSTLARHTGEEEGEAVRHLWGRLGILLQKGNAAILGNRVPSFPPPQIDGIA